MRLAVPLVAARWVTRCVTGDAVRLADGHGGSADADIVEDHSREGSGLYFPPKFGIRYEDPYLHAERCGKQPSCKVSGTELSYRCSCPYDGQVCAEEVEDPPERASQSPPTAGGQARTTERTEPGLTEFRGGSFIILAGLTGTVFASVLVLASIGRVIQFSFREVDEKHADVMAGVPEMYGSVSPARRILQIREDFAARVRAMPKSPGHSGRGRSSRFAALPPAMNAIVSPTAGISPAPERLRLGPPGRRGAAGRASASSASSVTSSASGGPARPGAGADPRRVAAAPTQPPQPPQPPAPAGLPPRLSRPAWGSARGESASSRGSSAGGSRRPSSSAVVGRSRRSTDRGKPSIFPVGDGAPSPLVPQIAPRGQGRSSSLTRQPKTVFP